MKFNLYHLCDEEINTGSIRVILNHNLRIKINAILLDLRKKYKLKNLSKIFGIKYSTLHDYCTRRNSIPLIVIKRLQYISNEKIDTENFTFVCADQKNKVKLPAKINENLAKIVGAIIADGHIKIRRSGRGTKYELVLREEYYSNVKAFANWFKDIFDLEIKINNVDKYSEVIVNSKIIILFLTKIINLDSGRKVDIVRIPKIFYNSNNHVKRSLLQGIFMFDGGVDYSTGYVSLVSKSQGLIKDVINILKDINIAPDYISRIIDSFGRSKILFRKTSKLEKCINLFEKDTTKWFRLNDHLYGPNEKLMNLNDLYNFLNRNYARKRFNSSTFTDFVESVKELQPNANILNINKRLKKGKTTTYSYLTKLKKWGILQSNKGNWELNERFYVPRR
jgi:hypothetical protein